MHSQHGKCPGCGLANFRDAAECQWCALALGGRAYTELSHEAHAPADKPWGLLLILFAVVIMGGGVLLHVSRKIVARLERPAATADAAAKRRERGGTESPDNRHDSDEFHKMIERPDEIVGRARQRDDEFQDVIEQYERGLYGEEEARRAREARRALAEPARKRRPVEERRPATDSPNEW